MLEKPCSQTLTVARRHFGTFNQHALYASPFPVTSLLVCCPLIPLNLETNGVQRKASAKHCHALQWKSPVALLAERSLIKFQAILFSLHFSDVSIDPQFLSGGGCCMYSGPTDSTRGLGVLKQRVKPELLWGCYSALLSFHSALLSVP